MEMVCLQGLGYYEMTVPQYTAAIIENKAADRNKYTAVKFTYTSDAAFDLYGFDDKITDAKGQTPDGQHMSQTLAAATEAKTITLKAGDDYSGKCITAIKIVNMGNPAHFNIKDVEFVKSTTEPTATPKPTNKPGGGSGGSVSTTPDEIVIETGKEYEVCFNSGNDKKDLNQNELKDQFNKKVDVSAYMNKIDTMTTDVQKTFMGATIDIHVEGEKKKMSVTNTLVGMDLVCDHVAVTGSPADGYIVVLENVDGTGSNDTLTVKQDTGKVTAVGTYKGEGCKFVTELTRDNNIKSFTYTTTADNTDVLKVSKSLRMKIYILGNDSFTISVDSIWAEKNGFYIQKK